MQNGGETSKDGYSLHRAIHQRSGKQQACNAQS